MGALCSSPNIDDHRCIFGLRRTTLIMVPIFLFIWAPLKQVLSGFGTCRYSLTPVSALSLEGFGCSGIAGLESGFPYFKKWLLAAGHSNTCATFSTPSNSPVLTWDWKTGKTWKGQLQHSAAFSEDNDHPFHRLCGGHWYVVPRHPRSAQTSGAPSSFHFVTQQLAGGFHHIKNVPIL